MVSCRYDAIQVEDSKEKQKRTNKKINDEAREIRMRRKHDR